MPESLLAKLQMTSTVKDYLSRFEQLLNRTSDIYILTGSYIVFTSGLRPNIISEVLSFRPNDLNDITGLAILQEQKLQAQVTINRPTPLPRSHYSHTPLPSNHFQKSSPATIIHSQQSVSIPPSPTLSGLGHLPYKKLTQRSCSANMSLTCALIVMKSKLNVIVASLNLSSFFYGSTMTLQLHLSWTLLSFHPILHHHWSIHMSQRFYQQPSILPARLMTFPFMYSWITVVRTTSYIPVLPNSLK